MAQIQARVLTLLDRIYKFAGGKSAPSTVQLESGIQLVHDVSRQAELGAGYGAFGGYYLDENAHLHTGVQVQSDFVDPYLRLQNGSIILDFGEYRAEDMDIWLIGQTAWALFAHQNVQVEFSVGLTVDATSGTLPFTTLKVPFPLLWNKADGAGNNFLTSADFDGGAAYQVMLRPEPNEPGSRIFNAPPILIPHGARLSCYSEVTTNTTGTYFHFLHWAGPRGSKPPGMG